MRKETTLNATLKPDGCCYGASLRSKAVLPLEKMRILLAEDSRVNQQVVLGHLCKLGYRAGSVANGLEVPGNVEARPLWPHFDGLPDAGNGWVRSDASHTPTGATPKSFCEWEAADLHHCVEAHAESDREKCLEVGMNDYLTKPMRPGGLQSALGTRKTGGSDRPPRTQALDALGK
jgi:CheY-like chemotaxis protein